MTAPYLGIPNLAPYPNTLAVINVLDGVAGSGKAGPTGVRDSYGAIQACINYAILFGGRVHVPAGRYRTSQTLSVNLINDGSPASVTLSGDPMSTYIIPDVT